MPKGSHRAHTPITSTAQRGLFGAELARRRAGKGRKMKGITTAELKGHLEESGGKNLPAHSDESAQRAYKKKRGSILAAMKARQRGDI